MKASNRESQRPRVLVVGPMPPTKGGVTTFMLNLMSSKLKAEFEFIPFTTSRPPKKNVVNNWGYAAMFRGGIGRVILGMLITFWHVMIFVPSVIAKRIDLVQIQASDYQAFWESAAYLLLARVVGRPCVFRIGGAFDEFYGRSRGFERRMISSIVRRPHLVIAQSELFRTVIEGAGRKRPVLVLPNWFPDTLLKPIAREIRSGACTFLFIAGSDAYRKGLVEVLGAARKLNLERSPARFVLVGVNPGLAVEIRALNLSNIEKIEDFASRDRILELMCASDVFLHPSHAEGFPNSLIEALGCGLPCIVTPVGAVAEIAANGGCIIVPAKNEVALADAIQMLAADPERRKHLAQDASKVVMTRYAEHIVLPKLKSAYRTLLQAP